MSESAAARTAADSRSTWLETFSQYTDQSEPSITRRSTPSRLDRSIAVTVDDLKLEPSLPQPLAHQAGVVVAAVGDHQCLHRLKGTVARDRAALRFSALGCVGFSRGPQVDDRRRCVRSNAREL